jgi:phosphonoacetaldehyde hydrolase
MSLRRVRGVIFDWAGTTVDYGCMGPVAVLTELFKSQGLSLTSEEARKDMGLLKIDHIRKIIFSENIKAQFVRMRGVEPTEADVKKIYKSFEPEMLRIIPQYSDLMPGIINVMHYLRKNQIKSGSTTGYTKQMMDILAPAAKEKGYEPGSWIASNEVSKGRPYPWMIFKNAERLNITNMAELIKVGDTIVDIQEGKNAGAWSVGVLEGSSLIGLGPDEVPKISVAEFDSLKKKAKRKYLDAGADFVIDSLSEVPELIDTINSKLSIGENPDNFFKLAEQPYKLFTPGPILTSRRVKLPMMVDWGSRETDYMQLVEKLRSDLTNLIATSNSSGYCTTIIQGSGTFGVESVINSAIPRQGSKLLVIINGQYGKRMAQIAKMLKIETIELEFDETSIPGKSEVKKILADNPSITHVGLVYSETTTGILNPIKEICSLVKSKGRTLIIDAISAIGAIPFDANQYQADFVIGSSNKGLQGVPGFAFVVSKIEALQQCKGIATSLSLDLYDQWNTLEKSKGSFRFTSPVHAIRSLAEALKELEEEGGIKKRYQRYNKMQKLLQKGMEDLGFENLNLGGHQGPVITTFLSPRNDKWDFERFYNLLKDKKCVIYPGKLTKMDTFRIGTIGALTENDIHDLLAQVKESMFWK